MARLIYFIKTPLPGGAYGFGYAERIRLNGDGFWAENVAVPVVEPTTVGWAISSHRLPDGHFAGHGYRVPKPEWFEVAQSGASASADIEILRRRAARHLCTTPLGMWCSHPEIRTALAQDRLAASLGAALALPDLLAHEDELFGGWKEARPQAASAGLAEADALAAAEGGPAADGRIWRRRLRLAALRRIDAAAVGREIFAPCPAFLGQPYLPFVGPGGWMLKAGVARMAHYWPTPESEARSRSGRSDPGLIHAVERQLCPWLPAPAGDGNFARTLRGWLSLAPLRAFESGSCFPLFPYRILAPEGAPPPGFSTRIQATTSAEMGGSHYSLAAAGLCPFIADPFRAHCAGEAVRLQAWAADLPALVAAKWGHCLG